jgi:putative membrane protein
MDTLTLRPEKDLRTLWCVIWAIVFAIGTLLLLLLMLANAVLFGIVLLLWLITMVLIVLWLPAYHATLLYTIEGDAIRGKGGVFWRKHVTVPAWKITNMDVTQGPLQRLFRLGTIHVQTAGAGGAQGAQAELRLLGIRDLEGVKEAITERIRGYDAAREARGAAPHSPSGDEQQILSEILRELQTIRTLLQNR